MQCAICKAASPSGTNCGFCKNHYCFKCSKTTEVDYGNLKPYLRAAWKCPSCRGEHTEISVPNLSPLTLSAPTIGTDTCLQEVMSRLNEISSKLDCLPELVADVASLRAELHEVKSQLSTHKTKNNAPNISKPPDKHKEHHKKKVKSPDDFTPLPLLDKDDPFVLAPLSSFDLKEFKQVYTKEDAYHSISHFWRTFDPDNWSIWYSEYKYPQDLTKVFMTCNLISGMFQRLDKMRKHAFASVCVFGDDNNSSISGVWVWRGQRLIFSLADCWQEDYEYYEWRKLDLQREETTRLVQEYFSWSGTDSRGRRFNQGKIFK